MDQHKERIICPECGSVESATIEHTIPWYSYVHTCRGCGYVIMESEWQRANKNNCFVSRLRQITKGQGQKRALLIKNIFGRNFESLRQFNARIKHNRELSLPVVKYLQKIADLQSDLLLKKLRSFPHHWEFIK